MFFHSGCCNQKRRTWIFLDKYHGYSTMSLIEQLIKGSPLDTWLFTDSPQFILESPMLWVKFLYTLNMDLSRIQTINAHFVWMVSPPFWNLPKILIYSQIIMSKLHNICNWKWILTYELYHIPLRNSEGDVDLIPPGFLIHLALRQEFGWFSTQAAHRDLQGNEII